MWTSPSNAPSVVAARVGLVGSLLLLSGACLAITACTSEAEQEELTFTPDRVKGSPPGRAPTVLKAEKGSFEDAPGDGGLGDAGSTATADAGSAAPPAVTFGTGPTETYTLLPAGAPTPCSKDGPPAELVLVNRQRPRGVTLSWLDRECKEVSYGAVELYGILRMNTFASHRWRVRDQGDGAILADFTLDSGGSFTVTAW